MGRKASSAAASAADACSARAVGSAGRKNGGKIRGEMARKRAISARIGGIYGGFLSRNHPQSGAFGAGFTSIVAGCSQVSCDGTHVLPSFLCPPVVPCPRQGAYPVCRITLHIGRFTVTIIVKSRNRRPQAARPPSRAAAQPRPPTNSAAASARPRRLLHAAGRAGADRRHPRSQGGGPTHCGGAALCAKPPAGGAGGATSFVSGGGHHRPPPDTGSAIMPMLA